MQINSLMTLVAIGLLFTCCSLSDDNLLYLSSKHAGQLQEGMDITISGIKIGRLETIQLQKDLSIISTLSFDEEIKLPKDARFTVETIDLLGTPNLSIHPGMETDLIKLGDTVSLSPATPIAFDSTLTGGILEVVQNWLGTDPQKDSILVELKKLNAQLEELKRRAKEERGFENPR